MLAAAVVLMGAIAAAGAGGGTTTSPGVLVQINEQLAARGLNVRAEQTEFFPIGEGRPSNRIHVQPFRWVPDDPRRLADGANITYLVDRSDGATASGLTNLDTALNEVY